MSIEADYLNSRAKLSEPVAIKAVQAYQDEANRHLEDAVELPAWNDPVEAQTFGPLDGGIDATLAERGSRYGAFTGHARITQAIKRAMVDSPKWGSLADDQREALEMVAHKIGRILNGDPNYIDSWHDIIGYTKLVEDRLNGVVR
jgi:hypothetical protein